MAVLRTEHPVIVRPTQKSRETKGPANPQKRKSQVRKGYFINQCKTEAGGHDGEKDLIHPQKWSQEGWVMFPLCYLLEDDGHLTNNEPCGTCCLNQAILSMQTQILPFPCIF